MDFLFVATLEEVRSSASRDVELAEFPYAETFPAAVRRHLYVAVSGVDVAASAESLTLQSPDGDGSFVNQVAGPVVTALASLTDEALPGLAATVAATAEAKAALLVPEAALLVPEAALEMVTAARDIARLAKGTCLFIVTTG